MLLPRKGPGLLVGLVLSTLASVVHAQGTASSIDFTSVENLLKFGALGLTALGLILGFYLLNSGRKGPGYAYLVVVLIAGFTFLYAELIKVKPGIDLVITPTQFSPSDAAPRLVYNRKPLEIQDGRLELQCDDRVLLTVNLENLVNSLSASHRTALAATSQPGAGNPDSVGFDEPAGGAP